MSSEATASAEKRPETQDLNNVLTHIKNLEQQKEEEGMMKGGSLEEEYKGESGEGTEEADKGESDKKDAPAK